MSNTISKISQEEFHYSEESNLVKVGHKGLGRERRGKIAGQKGKTEEDMKDYFSGSRRS